MRLASFNLLHGRSLRDGLVDGPRLTQAAVDLDADVVGLQEVDRDQERSDGLDLTALVADGMGAREHRFAPALVGTPGGRWRAAHDGDHPGGTEAHYGVGLASRYPVTLWRTVRLPAAPVRSPVLIPGTSRPILLKDEPRVGLVAVLDTPHGPLTVITTHLSFVPVWNGVQLRKLVAAVADLPGPKVLLGDLNMPGRLPAWLSGWTMLARTPTYPVTGPKIQLDHVLGHGPLPPVTATSARDLGLSDHCALIVDFA